MRRLTLLISVLCSVVAASAQNSAVNQPPPEEAEQERILRIQREFHLWQLENCESQIAMQLAERRAAEYRQHEFEEKINRFVAIFNKFVAEYNKQRTFNVKEARALSKAFRDLKATGWPE